MLDYDKCPGCGGKILKGALRCTGCGRIMKTQEEQVEAVRNYTMSRKKLNIRRLLENMFLFLVTGLLLYHFSDEILAFVKRAFIK